MGNNGKHISDELLAAFLDGNVDVGDAGMILRAMQEDPALAEIIAISAKVDEALEDSYGQEGYLPLAEKAALGIDAMCNVMCESYILSQSCLEYDAEAIVQESRDNGWLCDEGTPLHNIGALLESRGLFVRRMPDATVEELSDLLAEGAYVLAVVDAEVLDGPGELMSPDKCDYHAVVCLSVGNDVILYNPATGNEKDEYPLAKFMESWISAGSYMVSVTKEKPVYRPRPLKLDGVDIAPELLTLSESIAENAHEVWAAGRMNEGWTYGPARDDQAKQHPDLVAYSDLTESEKQFDRDMAFNTIRLVRKLGYDLVKRERPGRFCPNCGAAAADTASYCSNCGEKLAK